MPKIIEKKCWPQYFEEIVCGKRTADVRRDDVEYQAGDTLLLREFDPERGMYCGKFVRVTISTVQRCIPGLEEGWCVLSLVLDSSAAGWDVAYAGKFADESEGSAKADGDCEGEGSMKIQWWRIEKYFRGGGKRWQIRVPSTLTKEEWELLLEWIGENTDGGRCYGYQIYKYKLKKKWPDEDLKVLRYPAGICEATMALAEKKIVEEYWV